MKLVDDEKNTSCNGNGIIKDQVQTMISSEPPKVSANDDVHSEDSRSNSGSLNGAGDLLVEDPNTLRNGSEDTPFQNGNKADDTRSWSSNSSNLPPPDIDEDLSDEMTLRLSDEEEETENAPSESENTPPETGNTSIKTESATNEKDSIQFTSLTSSTLPTADPCTVADKNPFNKLIDGDMHLEESSAKDDSKSKSNINIEPSDNSSIKVDTDKVAINVDEEKRETLETLISEIMPEKPIIDTTNDNKSVTELSTEMEELLKTKDAEESAASNTDSTNMKSDVDLEQSTSSIDNSITNEDSSNEESINNSQEKPVDKETTATTEETCNEKEDIQEDNACTKEIKDDGSLNKELMDTNDIVSENKDEKLNEATTEIKEKSGSESDSSIKENNETNNSEKIETDTKVDNDEVQEAIVKNSSDEELNTSEKSDNIPEPMEIVEKPEDSNSANLNDSEQMEIDSNDEIEQTIISETAQKNHTTNVKNDDNKSDLIDIKDNILTLKEENNIEAEIENEDIKGVKVEENTKSLKRTLETDVDGGDTKKAKIILNNDKIEKKEYIAMNCFRDFMAKKEVDTMTRADLEEFCIQKVCECINQTSKVGELNRVVKQQEQVIESLRTKYNSLKKQIADISIVQNKMLQEVRTAKAKEGTNANVMPVKITRSVGLQVSLQAIRVRPTPQSPEQLQVAAPMQKRKLQRISLPNKLPSAQTPVTPITPAKPVSATVPKPPNAVPSPVKGIKTLLPRTYSAADINRDVSSSTNSLLGNYLTNTTPAKSPTVNVARKNNNNINNNGAVVVSNVATSTATTTTANVNANATSNTNTSKVIDLTDEDDVAKTTNAIPATPAGIRVVAPHQLNSATSTAVTSQMPRVTYLVSPGQQGQVLLATTSATTRPGGPRSTIMFKPVQQGQIPNGQRLNFVRPNNPGGGTVAVLPAASTASIRPGQQIRFQTGGTTVNAARTQMISSTRVTPAQQRHPAPLPGPPAVQPSQPTWKAMPPKPSLKISRVGDGIVLSWKMLNKDMSQYEDIASYQLYAYQETNALPATDMWRKVGDVKALALPMACTLTQFTDGNKYHFAVRAVDVKSRVGPFSQPEQIALP